MDIFGAGDRGRTGTLFTARDFKSLVSAYSTTPALGSILALFWHFVKGFVHFFLYLLCISQNIQEDPQEMEGAAQDNEEVKDCVHIGVGSLTHAADPVENGAYGIGDPSCRHISEARDAHSEDRLSPRKDNTPSQKDVQCHRKLLLLDAVGSIAQEGGEINKPRDIVIKNMCYATGNRKNCSQISI